MRIVRQLDENRWRDFVASQPLGNIFHTPEMFRVYERAKGFCPGLWAAETADGRILALLLPVEISILGQLFRRFSARSVVYGSTLSVEGNEGKTALGALLRTYVQDVAGGPLFTELRNISSMDSFQPVLRNNGFVYEDHLNFLIDLSCSPDAVFAGIGPRTRKVLRRGLRAARVSVEEVTGSRGLDECYELLRKTYKAARVPLAHRSLFDAAFTLLRPLGMVRFTLARVGSAAVATSVELLYKEVVFGWYGGVDRSYGVYAPNELLTWHILEWGAKNGYSLYDFGGAGRPHDKYGVRDFKAKFGGELVNFGRNTFVHEPGLLKVGRFGYRMLRSFL